MLKKTSENILHLIFELCEQEKTLTSECSLGTRLGSYDSVSLGCHSVSSIKFKIAADPVCLHLSVVISFIVSIVIVLLSVSLDIGKISKVAEDVVISIIIVLSRRFVVAENANYLSIRKCDNVKYTDHL